MNTFIIPQSNRYIKIAFKNNITKS